jgi:hypothetical protein
MSLLKSLNFVSAPKLSSKDPADNRRRKLITQLEQQRELALNPAYVVSRQKWVKQENGSKSLVEMPKRVKRWWTVDAAGNCFFVVRYGSKVLALQEGKAAIACNKEDLASIVQTVINAVAAGELDAVIEQVSAKGAVQAPVKQPKLVKRAS